MMWAPLTALSTLWDLHRVARRFRRDRAGFERWQQERVQAWLRGPVASLPAVKRHGSVEALTDLPLVDKATVMSEFAMWNQPGVTVEEGWAAFEGSRQVRGHHVGASTGTSGNRGLFVISERERYAWLGAMLAKALPGFWRRRERVAVILPLHTRLYDAANGFGPLRLRFFDLTKGVQAWGEELERFNPTVIVAPPKILRALAVKKTVFPRKVFAGAEVLDALDAEIIGAWAPLGQIHMATEGLMGVTCEHGHLHLCEDILHFELEIAGEGLVTPIVTDFRRTAQGMIRYRMNDLLRLDDQTCPCGSPLRVVKEVVGRQDDVFVFGGVEVTPDVLRNTVVDTDRSILDFRIRQHPDGSVEVQVADQIEDGVCDLVEGRMRDLLRGLGVEDPVVRCCRRILRPPFDRKLRRVERIRSHQGVTS